MSQPYFCPQCEANRTRFNIIEQVASPVKIDAATGDVVEAYKQDLSDPFHRHYHGPEYKVQCASCGMVAPEEMFVKKAQLKPAGQIPE